MDDCRGAHILCHSMGNHLLFHALMTRINHEMAVVAAAKLFAKIKSVVFAAADIARFDLSRVLQELEEPVCKKPDKRLMVLYCSRQDHALLFSSLLRWAGGDGSGRAGFYSTSHSIHPFMSDPSLLQTVDVSGRCSVSDVSGHGYFTSSKAVTADLKAVFEEQNQKRSTIEQVNAADVNCKTCQHEMQHTGAQKALPKELFKIV